MVKPSSVPYIAGMTSETSPLAPASAGHFDNDVAIAVRRAVPVLVTASPERAVAIVRAIAARAGVAIHDIVTCDIAAGANVLASIAACDPNGSPGRSRVLWLKDVHLLTPFQQAALANALSDPAGYVRARARHIVASTDVDLFERIGARTFDRRLFYCLNTVHIMAD